ncbi:MAG: T9SS type A sorting domain-containing protein [candidate division Zixibacteria bacterium]|nr:T9SS type A sorting domain-containing protein [candidate division Zixibacteria bacterium]
MIRKAVIIALAVAICTFMVSTATAQLPNIWVLQNSDPDFTTPPFEDALRLLDADGNIIMTESSFNICEVSGAIRSITASPVEQVCWVAEWSTEDKLHKVDADGNRLVTVDKAICATDVDRNNNVYALLNPGGGYMGKDLLILDSDGLVLKSVSYGGVDLVVDEEHALVWVVGKDIKLLDTDLQFKFSIDCIDWAAFSVDFTSDGSAWVAERYYTGYGRLLHISTSGDILGTVDLDFSPTCVRVDRRTGCVWTTGILGSQGLYRYDPSIPEMVKIAGFRGWSLVVDNINDLIWCTTYNDVRAYTKSGTLAFTNNSFPGWNQKWITTGPLIQYVSLDIKPGACPNPFNINKKLRPESWQEDCNSNTDAAGKLHPVFNSVDPEWSTPVLPAAIMGTTDFDVRDVDPTTIELNGVPLLRWNYEDVGSPVSPEAAECECTDVGADGMEDLTLKFDKVAIAASLGEVSDGDVVTLTLSGQLQNGMALEGADCIVIHIAGPSETDGDGGLVLIGNYPNPFNPSTALTFSLPQAANYTMTIYNLTGQVVESFSSFGEAGYHTLIWNAGSNASGIYFYKLEAAGMTATRKMMLVK